jgi:hypothetical protein
MRYSSAPPPPPAREPEPDQPADLPLSHAGLRVTEADYWRDYYPEADRHYEWNNGILEEKPVSDVETIAVYRWFLALLTHFLRVHPIAEPVCLEFGFRLPLPLPTGTVIRKPDLGVVRHDNTQPLRPLDCSYRGVFDLCIEALSDQDRLGIERDTLVKKTKG